jgi:hypothetical protein
MTRSILAAMVAAVLVVPVTSPSAKAQSSTDNLHWSHNSQIQRLCDDPSCREIRMGQTNERTPRVHRRVVIKVDSNGSQIKRKPRVASTQFSAHANPTQKMGEVVKEKPINIIITPYLVMFGIDQSWRENEAWGWGGRPWHSKQPGVIHSSKTKATATVATNMRAAFQDFLDDIELSYGASVSYMGGIRAGRCGLGSQHPCGWAVDFCQDWRGHVGAVRDCKLPQPELWHRIVRAHRLYDGSVWNSQDYGHVQAKDSGSNNNPRGNWAGHGGMNLAMAVQSFKEQRETRLRQELNAAVTIPEYEDVIADVVVPLERAEPYVVLARGYHFGKVYLSQF